MPFNARTHDVPLWFYTIRRSSALINLAFGLLLGAWLWMELGISPGHPETTHPRTHHLLKILTTLCASFVSGYIFFWITRHVPEMRSAYERQMRVEETLADMLGIYRRLMIVALTPIPREPLMKWDIYTIHQIDKNFQAKMFARGEAEVSPYPRRPEQVARYFPDPFGRAFDITASSVRHNIMDLLKERGLLRHDLTRTLDNGVFLLDLVQPDPDGELDKREANILFLCAAMRDIDATAKELVLKNEHCRADLYNAIGRDDIQTIWDDVAALRTK